MPFGDIRSMRPSPSIPSMGRIQCIINCAVMRINEQNYEDVDGAELLFSIKTQIKGG